MVKTTIGGRVGYHDDESHAAAAAAADDDDDDDSDNYDDDGGIDFSFCAFVYLSIHPLLHSPTLYKTAGHLPSAG